MLQWQMPTSFRSAEIVILTAPHRHRPVILLFSDIDCSVAESSLQHPSSTNVNAVWSISSHLTFAKMWSDAGGWVCGTNAIDSGHDDDPARLCGGGRAAPIWGATFPISAIALEAMPPIYFAFLRFVCAVAFVLVVPRPASPRPSGRADRLTEPDHEIVAAGSRFVIGPAHLRSRYLTRVSHLREFRTC